MYSNTKWQISTMKNVLHQPYSNPDLSLLLTYKKKDLPLIKTFASFFFNDQGKH